MRNRVRSNQFLHYCHLDPFCTYIYLASRMEQITNLGEKRNTPPARHRIERSILSTKIMKLHSWSLIEDMNTLFWEKFDWLTRIKQRPISYPYFETWRSYLEAYPKALHSWKHVVLHKILAAKNLSFQVKFLIFQHMLPKSFQKWETPQVMDYQIFLVQHIFSSWKSLCTSPLSKVAGKC